MKSRHEQLLWRIHELELKLVDTQIAAHADLPFMWRSPNSTHAACRLELLNLLLGTLADLAQQTDPALGLKNALDKDKRAMLALKLAGKLVDQVAGWALDHLYGVSLAKDGFQDITDADDHRYESVGGEYRSEEYYKIENDAARRLLRDVLHANTGGLPPWLRRRATEAFDGIAFGEMYPLLAPVHAKKKVLHSEAVLQLKALEFVEFRAASGLTKTRAYEEVADAYGVGPAAVAIWRSRLPDHLGWRAVADKIGMARAAGALVFKMKKLGNDDAITINDQEHDEQLIQEIQHEYSERSLLEYAKRHKERGKAKRARTIRRRKLVTQTPPNT